MNWLVLVICFLPPAGTTVFLFFLLLKQESRHREREITWERERERLLNRAMTKEWASYVQMQGMLQTNSNSGSDPAVGMSDEEELRRIGEIQGIGEVFVDLGDDARELGLTP